MKENIKPLIQTVLAIIVSTLIIGQLMSCSQENSRSIRNMSYISEGFCYDKDTRIVYIESYSRHGFDTIYTPYYDKNGNLCRYEIGSEEWIPIESRGCINEK